MAEEWRPVAGWPYEVSDQGRVRRSAPPHPTARGGGKKTQPGRVRKLVRAGRYLGVAMTYGKRRKLVHVHRLVAEAFLGPCPESENGERIEVNHKNADKDDNRPENLEYVTQGENIAHATRNQLYDRGEKQHLAKLTEEAVREIRDRAEDGETYRDISQDFDVTPKTVGCVVTRKTWRHVR